jgi:cell volume regulation protein A
VGFTDQFIFITGLLLVLSIVASVPADRSGVPLLVVFLVIGMLAGEDGPGGLEFDNVEVAHLIGSIGLAIILFDGGLHTPMSSFRTGFAPGLVLATVGVLLTAAVTAGAALAIFEIGWAQALLLAAIVSSTDAAAVFYLLRARGIQVHSRVRNTLEIESGVNDPLAIFLTIAVIEILTTTGGVDPSGVLALLGKQIVGGAIFGIAGGMALTWLVGRLQLASSLYPLLGLSGGLLVYGGTAVLGGSGFLAAYLAGLILGNRLKVARRNIQRFHDGMAWLCQIGLFLMLGLLATPSRLPEVAGPALLLAAALVFLARPLAVWLCLLPFRFSWQQIMFMSWVGLRGAVPIVLSLFPLLADVPSAQMAFDVIFFVVLISLLLQGWTVSPVARWLGLLLPRQEPDARRVDIARPEGFELVVCELPPGCPATYSTIGALQPPPGVRLISLIRDGETVPMAADLPMQAGDVLYLLVPVNDFHIQDRFEHWLDAVGTAHPLEEQAYFGEFSVDATAPMEAFAGMYLGGEAPDVRPDDTIGRYVRRKLRHRPSEGDRIRLRGVLLAVRDMDGDRIVSLGVRLPREQEKA